MAVFAGRLAEVAVSTDGSTFVDVERVVSPRLIGANETANASSNDSAGHEEIIATWQELVLTFDMLADEVAVGQEMLWTAFMQRTPLYVRFRPRGDLDLGEAIDTEFWALVTEIGQRNEFRDASRYAAKLERTGEVTREVAQVAFSLDETYEPPFPGGNVFPAVHGAAALDETYEPPFPGGNVFPAVHGAAALDETYDAGSGFPGT